MSGFEKAADCIEASRRYPGRGHSATLRALTSGSEFPLVRPRSGTKLQRNMLDVHPLIVGASESGDVPTQQPIEALLGYLRQQHRRTGGVTGPGADSAYR